MSETKVPEPYSVSPASLKCECCGDGPTWEVVLKLDGQPEIAMGTEYEEESAAGEVADGLNAAFAHGWTAALEWAAGQVGNKCTLLPGCGINAISTIGGSRPDRERHDPRCPIALAAKIREGAP